MLVHPLVALSEKAGTILLAIVAVDVGATLVVEADDESAAVLRVVLGKRRLNREVQSASQVIEDSTWPSEERATGTEDDRVAAGEIVSTHVGVEKPAHVGARIFGANVAVEFDHGVHVAI